MRYLPLFPCLFVSAVFAADIPVNAGGNLQGAINSANPGDTITLQAGAVFNGPFYLTNKQGTAWITIRSSAWSALPPEGVRVSPSNAPNMPTIVGSNGNPAFATLTGANHWKLQGLEIVTASGQYNFTLITLGDGSETSASQLPQFIELDQLYIHGDPIAGSKRGVTLNSRDTLIRNCYISDFKSTTQDAQAIMGWNGPGPYRIVNNYLEGSGENIMFGGATPSLVNNVPSNIDFRQNYCRKPLSWRQGDPSYAGTPWQNKNLFELKDASHIVVDGNVFENSWKDQQAGFAILISPRVEIVNGVATAPWAHVSDLTFTRNIVQHASSGIDMTGHDDNGGGYGQQYVVRNNLWLDLNNTTLGGDGRLFQVLNGTDQVTLDHNTGFQNDHVLFFDDASNTNLTMTNNLAPLNTYGIFGSGIGSGTPALNFYETGYSVTNNALWGSIGSSAYPAGNWFPSTVNQVGFVNAAAGNYQLSPSSPYVGQATDGTDVGVDTKALNSATAGVIQNLSLLANRCVTTVSNRSNAISAAGGIISVTVTSPAGCSWQTRTLYPWITITSASASQGIDIVNATVAPLPIGVTKRVGSVNLGNVEFAIVQQ